MPRLVGQNPKYRKHASGQAILTLNGKTIYLGPHGTQESRREYDRVIAEWLANGRRLSPPKEEVSIGELILAYLDHAQAYYRKPDGSISGELSPLTSAMNVLAKLYGHTRAIDYGPLALEATRAEMIRAGWCRTNVNKQVNRLRQAFKWGASKEIIPETTYSALRTLAPLLRGRTEARESEPVRPVPEADLELTLRFLAQHIRDMIHLQLLTGMRPGELVRMRGCDLDMSGKVWAYTPAGHKTEHHGYSRTIWLGPKAIELVQGRLMTNLAAHLFTPRQAVAAKTAKATTHRRPDQKPNRRKTKRTIGERYTVAAYRKAIRRACERADAWLKAGRVIGNDETLLAIWHPHQLRHNAATTLRKEYGIEATRIILGHQSVDVTEIYAEEDVAKAIRIMAEVG